LKPAPTNDGVYPRTAPCGPAARTPRSNVHPFTRWCRTDHARHRMHSGGGFETRPHYGVLMRQTMGSTNPPHHAGQRLAFPGTMCTRSPAAVAPIMPVTACIVGAGLKPAPTNDGFHPPTAPCGPEARVPRNDVHPFTRCCRTDHARHRMHSGGRFETCPHYGVLMRRTMGSTNPPHHAGQRLAFPGTMCTRSPAAVAPIMPVTACIVGAGLKPAPTMVC